jgi:hypothetical protein
LRVRGPERVQLHADLTVLARLAGRSLESEPFPSRRKPLRILTPLTMPPPGSRLRRLGGWVQPQRAVDLAFGSTRLAGGRRVGSGRFDFASRWARPS